MIPSRVVSGANSGNALSMRERAEIDAAFGRVRGGEHYTVLGASEDATSEVLQRSYSKMVRWLETLDDRADALGEYQGRVQLIASAVQNAWRILGNPTMRMRYDEQRRQGGASERPVRPQDFKTTMPDVFTQREVRELMEVAQRNSQVQSVSPGSKTPPVGNETPSRAAPAAAPITTDPRSQAMVAIIEVHLGAAFGRSVTLLVGELAVVYSRRAEEAEARGDWIDAVGLWHSAILAAPEDVSLLRRATAALRSAGASSDLLKLYTRRAEVMELALSSEASLRARRPQR